MGRGALEGAGSVAVLCARAGRPAGRYGTGRGPRGLRWTRPDWCSCMSSSTSVGRVGGLELFRLIVVPLFVFGCSNAYLPQTH